MPLKFIDPRDNNEYSLVRIGNQLWFAENLRYDVEDCCFMYDHEYSSFKKNGYLYSQDALEYVCPPGWRIPSAEDFLELYRTFERSVKSASLVEKLSGKLQDENIYLQLGGYGSSEDCFYGESEGAYFWTSTKGKTGDHQCCVMDSLGMRRFNPDESQDLFSVRLVYGSPFSIKPDTNGNVVVV